MGPAWPLSCAPALPLPRAGSGACGHNSRRCTLAAVPWQEETGRGFRLLWALSGAPEGVTLQHSETHPLFGRF